MKKEGKINLEKVLKITGWVFAVLVFFVVLGASAVDTSVRQCSRVYIKIDHDSGLFFVNDADVTNAISSFYKADITGEPIKDLQFQGLEEQIESNPYVGNADVYSDNKGCVYVDVVQRKPLVRVVNNNGVSYYLDTEGQKMPLSSKFTARVVVATGSIDYTENEEVLTGLVELCRFISADEFWQAQFEQISITGKGDFELVPKLGNYIIRIGKPVELHEKFEKLMIFYKEVLKNFDSDEFRVINLKFTDQIVCTKNI